MKDALGHGSNVGNQAAARMLANGHPKAVGAPVHDSMAHAWGSPSRWGSPHAEYKRTPAQQREQDRRGLALRASETDEYNRDLRLRSRNGQVGSGMSFRG